MNSWQTKDTKELFKAISTLNNIEEIASFMRDLLTIKEIETFSARWKAATMLEAGIPYSKIEKETGLSSATIARVNQYREYGMGGYKNALKKTAKPA